MNFYQLEEQMRMGKIKAAVMRMQEMAEAERDEFRMYNMQYAIDLTCESCWQKKSECKCTSPKDIKHYAKTGSEICNG